MNEKRNTPEYESSTGQTLWRIFQDGMIVFGILAIMLIGAIFVFTPAGDWLTGNLSWLFATDSQQLWWFVTRSSAIIAFLLLWLSTVWGLAVPSRIISPVLEPGYTFDFHQFISLLAIGFALLHILVLSIDRYLPYSTLQILIPFLSPYRPLWVGIGVISFYIIMLVTVTFYLRTRIGMRTFRSIHILSLLSYIGVTLHGLNAGTDSPLLSMQLLYRGTGLTVVFLTVYWLVLKFQSNREAKQKAAQAKSPASVRRQPRVR